MATALESNQAAQFKHTISEDKTGRNAINISKANSPHTEVHL